MRYKFQFSLRQLLFLTAIVALLLALTIGAKVDALIQRRNATATIESLGGFVSYDYQWHPTNGWMQNAKPPGNALLKRLLGSDYCSNVVEIQLFAGGTMHPEKFDDDSAARISVLSELKWLVIMNSAVTDAGLRHFAKLKAIERIDLDGSNVTEKGVRDLQRALPGARIFY